ncbi:hypothetical protein ACH4ZX_36720 [Streptomyces sp. NPDC020490]|uniref:hypothetical protein n=1 Tax=Streptomyces sp. NPDC020490 TaxID=3365078 RepID=UPI0037B339B8
MTIAAAQGLTCDCTLVYGVGADANSLYPALSRDRIATHLWLPADVVESDETRRRLGERRATRSCWTARSPRTPTPWSATTTTAWCPVSLRPRPRRSPRCRFRTRCSPSTNASSTRRSGARPPEPADAAEQRSAAVREDPGDGGTEGARTHPEAAQEAAQATAEHEVEPSAEGRAVVRQAQLGVLRERLQGDGTPELTDEQKARLEKLLAAGFASRAEQQPEPEFEACRDRPYGHVGTQRLTSLIAERTAQARRAERLAADLARQAEAKREALAVTVTPGLERAREVAEVLDRADQLALPRLRSRS